MAMESTVMHITPDMAKAWLAKNMDNNRKINQYRVATYAREMAGGCWDLTHQGIAFDEAGQLVDGQHRLHAIIRANVPVDMMVTTGLKHERGEILNIDVGANRTGLNLLQISGIDDPVRRYMIPTVKQYWRFKRPGAIKPSHVEVQDYITRHYDDISNLFDAAKVSCNGRTGGSIRIPGIVCAALLGAMYRGVPMACIEKFCAIYRLNDVDGCDRWNPQVVLNLREYMRGHAGTPEAFAFIENTIRCFEQNKKVVRIMDCYPYIAEFDA